MNLDPPTFSTLPHSPELALSHMFKVSAKLLYITLPLFTLLGVGALAIDDPGSSQIPLDSAPPIPIPFPLVHLIHPGHTHHDKCVDVKGADFENGTPVQLCVHLPLC